MATNLSSMNLVIRQLFPAPELPRNRIFIVQSLNIFQKYQSFSFLIMLLYYIPHTIIHKYLSQKLFSFILLHILWRYLPDNSRPSLYSLWKNCFKTRVNSWFLIFLLYFWLIGFQQVVEVIVEKFLRIKFIISHILYFQ